MSTKNAKQCLLIVDDAPENIDILGGILRADYKIMVALNAEKALKIAKSETTPDLILLDIVMPGMDGYEICQQLKAHPDTKDIPIIFVTSKNDTDDEAKGLALGAVDYITKPINNSIVKARIRTQLELKKHRDHLEEMVKQRTLELEKAHKVRNEFVACVTHELQTPMNGVIGMCQLLLSTTELDDEQKNYLEVMYSSSMAQTTIINDILEFSTLEANSLEIEYCNFKLNSVIQTVIDMVKIQIIEKNLALKISIDPDLPTIIRGDSGKIRQILFHLVGNAVKFTNQGEITINVTSENNDKIKFSITDSGIGIPVSGMEKLFKPFSQLDSSNTRSYGGLGLGLINSKRMVEQMGGVIGVESVEKQGSTFWFSIHLQIE